MKQARKKRQESKRLESNNSSLPISLLHNHRLRISLPPTPSHRHTLNALLSILLLSVSLRTILLSRLLRLSLILRLILLSRRRDLGSRERMLIRRVRLILLTLTLLHLRLSKLLLSLLLLMLLCHNLLLHLCPSWRRRTRHGRRRTRRRRMGRPRPTRRCRSSRGVVP